MNDPLVEILMATYNGEAHIAEQLDSLIAQSYANWKVLVHDDGSTDATVRIVAAYASRYPERIIVLDDGHRCGGAKSNFAHLMAMSSADYIFFCDQDDVWLSSKVADSVKTILAAEAVHRRETPLAVFTDLTVVDAKLNVLADSMWEFQRIKPELADSVNTLAVRNCMTGCTMLMNRAAVGACLPIPAYAVMHDWWCGLKILQARGRLIAMKSPLVLYRQHGSNVVGARRWGPALIARKLLNFGSYWGDLRRNFVMAKHFLPELTFYSFALKKLHALR
ncbi:glycosyltransferase family 2 protein [Candidimonas sp. SYP-B2681]|uniref:glycosyltransferase family 2 protein n=1 Tax=Candidimonas sp. SYP-B2681 TaxID=2497686 RepID=UPI000F8948FC|nr:glycosyltransferase family 2 protein [Candidimonas sp. SYP-B2681]RTZ43158.1 glycosyltransferase family 2 protein [Candidimonas sp. SYP-B2681]